MTIISVPTLPQLRLPVLLLRFPQQLARLVQRLHSQRQPGDMPLRRALRNIPAKLAPPLPPRLRRRHLPPDRRVRVHFTFDR